MQQVLWWRARKFSPEVQDALQKTKSSFDQQQLSFDIEPSNVSCKEDDTENYHIYRCTGSFIYGFQKDGIFHVIPGDTSSQADRVPNESGEIVFYLNKQTGKVDTIQESMAGNYWGIAQKKTGTGSRMFSIFLGMVVIFVAIVSIILYLVFTIE